jgi:hypothetical protein
MDEEDKNLVDLIITEYIAEAGHDVKRAKCSWKKKYIYIYMNERARTAQRAILFNNNLFIFVVVF